jgi:hypothetical protein
VTESSGNYPVMEVLWGLETEHRVEPKAFVEFLAKSVLNFEVVLARSKNQGFG